MVGRLRCWLFGHYLWVSDRWLVSHRCVYDEEIPMATDRNEKDSSATDGAVTVLNPQAVVAEAVAILQTMRSA
jgi:hypothetical protein